MTTPARNIELKARLDDLESARQLATRLATRQLATQSQVDTYFYCAQGRLKLRAITGQTAQLISYSRADHHSARDSNYWLVPVPEPELMRTALTAALGVRVVVRKLREIFLYHNVRIHLDCVDGLGAFLEFESVLLPDVDETLARERLEWLHGQFSLRPESLVARSYSDLLAPPN